MPNNLFTNVVPQMMAQALPVLRKNSKLPRYVNRDLENMVALSGAVIDVPIIDDATVRDVSPAATWPTAVTVQPTKVQVTLDWWKEVPFTMEDADIAKVNSGTLPARATAALEALARAVDVKLALLGGKFYNVAGVAGTTPFSSTLDAFVSARAALNWDKAPMDPRTVVLDAQAEGNAIALPQFLQAHMRGDADTNRTGEIGYRIGADWVMDQNIQTHTAGGLQLLTTAVIETAVAAGASEISIRVTTGSLTLLAGDIFVVGAAGGLANTYVVRTTATVTGTLVTIPVSPDARAAYTTGTAIYATAYSTHVMNLYFHKNALAWASRPLAGANAQAQNLGSVISQVVDPISGLAFRLEVSRQYKQTTWSWDILGGANCVRPALGCRIMG